LRTRRSRARVRARCIGGTSLRSRRRSRAHGDGRVSLWSQ
jgi:hypothetical protein